MDQIRVPRKSLMELLVIGAPLLHFSGLLYHGFYFVSLDIPFLLISVFPKESRNVFTISLCLAWETFIVSVLCAWGTYAIYAITSFILTLKDTVDLVMMRIPIR